MSQTAEWLSRWQRGQTGFHQTDVDPHLRRFWPSLQISARARVLVPMSGKSLDVRWLHQAGFAVVAIDISLIAIESLLQESGTAARREVQGHHQVFSAPGLTAVCGDFFLLDELRLPAFPAVYDRAAFSAMAPEYREAYVQNLVTSTSVGSRVLMTLLEYPPHETHGPPFAIDGEELRQRTERWFSVRCLDRADVLAADRKMQSRGVTRLHEVCYVLERVQ